MPKLHNVHFPTRDKNILHQVYTNIPGAYKATLSPHLGLSDHISIEMIPSYRPLFCRTQPGVKTVQVWSDEAISQLQDCFENTEWELFAQSTDLEYSSSVLAYIAFCTDTVLTTNTIMVFPKKSHGLTGSCGLYSGRGMLPTGQGTSWPTVMPEENRGWALRKPRTDTSSAYRGPF